MNETKWKLLQVGEVIKEGDEVLERGEKWVPAIDEVGWILTEDDLDVGLIYRRRVKRNRIEVLMSNGWCDVVVEKTRGDRLGKSMSLSQDEFGALSFDPSQAKQLADAIMEVAES